MLILPQMSVICSNARCKQCKQLSAENAKMQAKKCCPVVFLCQAPTEPHSNWGGAWVWIRQGLVWHVMWDCICPPKYEYTHAIETQMSNNTAI